MTDTDGRAGNSITSMWITGWHDGVALSFRNMPSGYDETWSSSQREAYKDGRDAGVTALEEMEGRSVEYAGRPIEYCRLWIEGVSA